MQFAKARIKLIRPLAERLDSDVKDTFDNQAWWRENRAVLPAWSSTLRAALCHATNSAPPQRTFSILNDSIGNDQTFAKADYKKALMILQYNNRGPISWHQEFGFALLELNRQLEGHSQKKHRTFGLVTAILKAPAASADSADSRTGLRLFVTSPEAGGNCRGEVSF
jgi:hypothetical protein